ncbi:response regulator transcription factor [Paenibacillus thalictri]|uniref:response regulator transcription factor n=1 Tax=Paenibacillus thalictri TaxID=2527873 RepID=UPI0026C0C249
MDKKVLVVDDERSISSAVVYALGREGFQVETAANGEEALIAAERFRPHVLVLDVMMPGLSGYDVCRKLEHRKGLGILLLTAKNDIVDKVLGLELGADDYMTKPFDIRELVARVRALARRIEKSPDTGTADSLVLGALTIQPSSRQAAVHGERLLLTPKEFDLLYLLVSHPERVYTREELLELVWGINYAGGTRTVDIHMQRIRKKSGRNTSSFCTPFTASAIRQAGENPYETALSF